MKKKPEEIKKEPIQLTKIILPKIEKKKCRIVGTPDYMAPEVLKGIELTNPVIDWWSVGLIYFLLKLP